MLGLYLGLGPIGSLILDGLMFILIILLIGYLLKIRRLYGKWISLANCDQIVLAIGRDNHARLICGQRTHGIYLDMGSYGQIPLDGEAVYKIINVPQKNSISIIYLPYALMLRAKELAGIRNLEKGKVRTTGYLARLIDNNGNILYTCQELHPGECDTYVEEFKNKLVKENKIDPKTLRVEREELVETEINEPVIIRPQDIRHWQVYSFNPIILKSMNESYLVSELGQYKGILESIWIKILPIVAILTFIAFVLAIIK